MDEAAWTELRLHVALSEEALRSESAAERFLEPLTDAAHRVSPGGVVLEGSDAPPGDDPPPAAGTVRLKIYVPDPDVEAARAVLAGALGGYPGARVEARPLDPDWRERWKQWFVGFDVSERLRVRPPWEAPAVRAGQSEVVVEPGMAFGTGQHETTQLCLRWLDGAYSEGRGPQSLLDVGCGTGILAVAALKLGAREVVGVDVDPDAVAMAIENAERNAVSSAAAFSTTPAGALDGTWPLVVANILAHILEALRHALVARTAPGGTLILSGMLEEQADRVCAGFIELGMREVGRRQQGEWVLAELRRP